MVFLKNICFHCLTILYMHTIYVCQPTAHSFPSTSSPIPFNTFLSQLCAFFFFQKNSLNLLNAACMCLGIALFISWNMVAPWGQHSEENRLSSPKQPSIVSNQVGFHELLPNPSWNLISLFFYRPCACRHSYCEFVCATTLSCLVKCFFFFQTSTTSASQHFSPLILW